MPAVEPTPEQLRDLLAGEIDEPLLMLNLLRFRERADYPADFDAEPCSGEQAYQRYGTGALVALGKVGARPVWAAEAGGVVIGPADEAWDQAFLVYYPSLAAFIEMTTRDPGYAAVLPHRTAALADSRLIRCDASAGIPELPGARA